MARLHRALLAAVLLQAAAAGPSAAAAGANRPGPASVPGFSEVGGATSGSSRSSWLGGLRRLQRGELAEDAILFAQDAPIPPAPGVSVTLDSLDVDVDGDHELLQVRGTATKPKLVTTRGDTGAPLWERSMSTIAFVGFALPEEAEQQDVLLFDSGMVRRLDGVTGSVLWQRPLPAGPVGYWGISPTPDGGDVVLGAWTVDTITGQTGLTLEFRALSSGSTRGTLALEGQGGCGGDPECRGWTYPTAALAGDLDADGVGDVFTLSPQYAYGAASGGVLEAYTGRGATRAWGAAFLVPATDDSFLVAATDATGDGRRDPVLVSEWFGAFGVDRATTTVSIVDGNGGDTSGLDPATQVTLNGYPSTFTLPGDANGDGGQDLVFSGAVHYPASNEGSILFEAVGKNGVIWQGGPRYAVSLAEMGAGWYTDAGDLDGDGTRDALVLMGTGSKGVDFVAGVSMRSGATLWSRTGTNGRFSFPAYGDLDGDGGDDVVHEFWAWHPEVTKTSFSFTAASGVDLTPLWSDLRTADSGANGWTIYAIGGIFDRTANEDALLEYVMAGPGRHLAAAFQGATGELLWTSP